ncbi:30S ribosomal protein S8 [Candidatus Daviesbacteria bacterium]|nr:30S ribosomal protein S8 [Candidatus Daviesbacteria bacterium]
MIMVDPIADGLIRIKNGYLVGKISVNVRFSKLILRIMKLLQQEGYIESVKQNKGELLVILKYNGRVPVLTDVKRVSTPSLRIYKGVKSLPSVLNGLGVAIVSTPKGVMTDKEARKQRLGGEVLALVW